MERGGVVKARPRIMREGVKACGKEAEESGG